MASDVIGLFGIRLLGRHGVHAFEREQGQPFEVDLEIETDVSPAARNDDLNLTIDYCRVYEMVRDVVEGPPCRLIETLAERLAGRILTETPAGAVRVRVRKPRAALPGATGVVQVEILRKRGDEEVAPC